MSLSPGTRLGSYGSHRTDRSGRDMAVMRGGEVGRVSSCSGKPYWTQLSRTEILQQTVDGVPCGTFRSRS